MQVLYRCCYGLDLHAKPVVACLIRDGKKQTRTFSTMTDDLLALSDWLTADGCTHAAVESTGGYWQPVFTILEGSLAVVLVNARYAKAVPGRKTAVRESWEGITSTGSTGKGSAAPQAEGGKAGVESDRRAGGTSRLAPPNEFS